MKKTYQTLFKDIVIDGIYHRWIKQGDKYFMHIDIEGDIKLKSLSSDKKEAEQAFHYFNMLFCSYFDTDGRQAYIDVTCEYMDAVITRRLESEDITWLKTKPQYDKKGLS